MPEDVRYGNRKVSKMIREWRALADLCRAEGTPAIQDALDNVEQHIDYAYGSASSKIRSSFDLQFNKRLIKTSESTRHPMKNTKEKLRELISNHLGIPTEMVTDGAKLVDDLCSTWFDSIKILMAVEVAFGIQVDDIEWGNASTFSDVLALVNQKNIKAAA